MVKWEQTEKMLNAFFPKKYGMTYLQMIWYEENIPARGWDLENDTITKTVGRKTILNKY
jgi:endonuclease-3